MEQTLTDWKPKHGSVIMFRHESYPDMTFNGVIRSSTVGKVLVEMPDNAERYVWFLKNDIQLL